MRVLCVAEKPSIAKSITQILSGGQFETHHTQTNYVKNYEFDYPQSRAFFIVTCVSGHITEHDFTDAYKRWNSCDPFDLFDAQVDIQIASDKKGIQQNLTNQARRSDMLMIWTDCDREGEHIGMEITKVCRRAKPNIQVKRARFSAIIAQQIHRAAQNPVELDRRQADAVEARIMLDLRIGAAFTRLQTLTLQRDVPHISEAKSVVSYGPCQFPTLGFVVQRYNLVKGFEPEAFWYIYLSLSRPDPSGGLPEETKFNWKRHDLFFQRAVVELFAMMMENPIARVTKVTKKTTKKWKPLPLTTVELQKAASRLLRLAPKRALDIAEKLYQQGFVSYPRTETDIFDPQFDHQSLIAKQTADNTWGQFATSLQNGGYQNPRRGKNDDKAHPPIHPTAHANNLNGDEKRVYEYITRRYLACCSKDAEGWQTTIEVICGGEEFSATGLFFPSVVVRERNYLNVYIYDKWTDNNLPEFEEGEEFEPTSCEIRSGETSKPNYLTEADLVTLMDKNGIGTDATIAQHIAMIVDRSYVIERMEGATKYLVPSTLGIGLVEGYNQIGLAKNVSKPQLRRETERRMIQVCEGNQTKHEMLERSLEQYKEMFVIVRREFARVTDSVQRYLTGQGDRPVDNRGGGNDPRGGGGGGGGGGDGGEYDPPNNANNGGAAGRGGGARGRGAAPPPTRAAPSARGRGKKAAAADLSAITVDGSDNDLLNPKPKSTPKSQSRKAAISTKPASSVASSSTSRVNEPIVVSSTWQARITPSTAYTSTPASYTSTSSTAATTSYGFYSSNSTGKAKATSAIPDCECGVSAIRKTIESGYSAGKQYWSCQIVEDGCGFYESIAEAEPLSPAAPSIPAKRTYSLTTNDDPLVVDRLCDCKEEAIQLTVVKEGANQGRKFWKCRKRDEGVPCKFFEWDDQPPGAKKTPTSTGGPYNGSGGGGSMASSTDVCYKCQQTGHWASHCPTEGTANNKRSRSFGTSSNNNAASGAECFKCHQIGHFSTACPNGTGTFNRSKSSYAGGSTGRGGGAASSTDECYKCGRTGHWSTHCTAGGSSSGKRSLSSGGTTPKRGRGGGRGGGGGGGGGSKRGRGTKKKSAFAAADDY
ncbi:DNA topoisomerase [Crepidotus variabilis]|uniref:DNA topoisomerase n=1 Tax=Crepidotus variabilis TaxID=179855 RepID=A0A9P6E6L3_9AGAR|nr:DNA topoisomerase [Crepidotus variabilis]